VRLTSEEKKTIKQYVSEIFGFKSCVYLFGSRVDDFKKGGDIDLYIEPENIHNEFEQRISLITKLQLALGDQKIDVVLQQNADRLIEVEAKKTGILL
jgi:uncharacterized protein